MESGGKHLRHCAQNSLVEVWLILSLLNDLLGLVLLADERRRRMISVLC